MLTKAFDWIHTAADKAFFAHCTCNGDVCQCKHDGQHFHINANKDSSTMNILEQMKAAGVKLDDISAAAKNMPAQDLKVLIKALSDEVRAKEAKTGKEAVRLQKLQAAMEASSHDQSAQNLLKNVKEELRRAGLPNDLNAAAQKGGYTLGEVDKALKASDWQTDRKIAFKNKLDLVGLLNY
jgi:hypothetical protein